ncbi:MAG: aromatic ring-hydroxylating dioxygenase subunit alpha [Spirochaetes bacterium]|nr:aromatic ring-hydroxylating dioxygenase subunit alpha [Spirochaetota bacterium]
MVRNQWYVVLESRELKDEPLGAIRMGERMVFWRDASGKAICQVDKCAHRGASLALGKIVDGHVQCPFHGLQYDPAGKCVIIPANGRSAPVPEAFKLKNYPTHEERGFIWIYFGEPGCESPAQGPRFFDDIPEDMKWSTVVDPWDNHYTRVIENQLDQAHLPFVHHNTIGRGNKTVVDGPGILRVEDGFFVFVFNRLDDGRPRRTSAEVPVPDPSRDYKLELRYPNLWQNYISPKVRVVGAFVPVDDTHTLLYLRFYQSFMRAPVISSLVNWMAGRLDLIVAHQDRRIVNTELPRGDGMGTGEILFPGDGPIMEYRKLRLEAMRKLAP